LDISGQTRRQEQGQRPGQEHDQAELDVCGRVGAEFGLGEIKVRQRHTHRDPQGCPLWGCLGISVMALGLAGSIALLSTISVPWRVTYALIAGLALLGLILSIVALVVPRRLQAQPQRQVDWWCVYAGGAAELRHGFPPAVLRWHEVESMGMTTDNVAGEYDEDGPSYLLRSCYMRGSDAVVNFDEYGISRLARPAYQALAPRFLPPLTSAYDRGAPAIIGNVYIDQLGITTSDGRRISWRQVGSVRMHYPRQWSIGVASLIELRDPAGKLIATLDPNYVPNGIFLGDVVRHAAIRQGVPLTG
jgi:hypothetical protein